MEMSAFPDIKTRGNGQIGKKGCRQKKGMSGKLAGIDVSARHVADMMPSFPTCCVIVLLSCQPLMDGICDDVLDVVEGITG